MALFPSLSDDCYVPDDAHPDVCVPTPDADCEGDDPREVCAQEGVTTFDVTHGYRRVPGDQCQPGNDDVWQPEVKDCPGKGHGGSSGGGGHVGLVVGMLVTLTLV